MTVGLARTLVVLECDIRPDGGLQWPKRFGRQVAPAGGLHGGFDGMNIATEALRFVLMTARLQTTSSLNTKRLVDAHRTHESLMLRK